ncbi:hypothetical protein [Leuconostoc pseudomesenteroides]|uniref:hypothetical protein n=1 Tax=Leuconostoc pseudomesenteroides TaxID=33968 RepID=UPI0039EBE14E
MSFDVTKEYQQFQILEELGGMAGVTFRKHYRSDKKFPKPIFDSRSKKIWRGGDLERYFDKKSGR